MPVIGQFHLPGLRYILAVPASDMRSGDLTQTWEQMRCHFYWEFQLK